MFLITVFIDKARHTPYGYLETKEDCENFCVLANNFISEAYKAGINYTILPDGRKYIFGDYDNFEYIALEKIELA
jgi:hypothetical protein